MQAPGPADAFLVIDVQNDFLPGGALGVTGGNAILAPINALLAAWHQRDLPVFLSRDWHPGNHCSFAAQGGPWPVHCVAGTQGAEFAPGLAIAPGDVVISKAMQPDKDAYSALDGTALGDTLRVRGITRVFIAGLATDYCISATGRDARAAALDVVILTDAVRAVNVQPGDGDRALAELVAAGCELSTTAATLRAMEPLA
jgi:nicotinamidase/pyrazinamidase